MVEVASSNLVTPTRFESPNLFDWGFFYACNITAVAENTFLYRLIVTIIQADLNHLKK